MSKKFEEKQLRFCIGLGISIIFFLIGWTLYINRNIAQTWLYSYSYILAALFLFSLPLLFFKNILYFNSVSLISLSILAIPSRIYCVHHLNDMLAKPGGWSQSFESYMVQMVDNIATFAFFSFLFFISIYQITVFRGLKEKLSKGWIYLFIWVLLICFFRTIYFVSFDYRVVVFKLLSLGVLYVIGLLSYKLYGKLQQKETSLIKYFWYFVAAISLILLMFYAGTIYNDFQISQYVDPYGLKDTFKL